MKATRWAAVCSLGLIFSVKAANAQPNAVELFDKGRALMDKGQFAEACKLFGDSNGLDPSLMGSILNLGLCNERQDNLATALAWYRKAQVQSQGAALEAATSKITELTELVPVATLNFPGGTPANAIVKLDGKVIPSSSWARIEIDRGQHDIEVTVPNKKSYKESIDLPARARKTLEVTFGSESNAASNPAEESPSIVMKETNWKRNAFVFGGIGAALTIAAPLSAYAFCGSPGECNTRNGLRRTKIISTPLLIGGVALLGVGAYYYFVAPRKETTRTALVPTVGTDVVGVALLGGF